MTQRLYQPEGKGPHPVSYTHLDVYKRQVYLYVVPFPQDFRAMGGPVLEMYISSPKKDIIRTQAYHFMGSAKKEPQFELEAESCPLTITEFEGGLSVQSGKTELKITKSPASFTLSLIHISCRHRWRLRP